MLSTPGIYAIANIVAGKLYIGSSKNILTRISFHLRRLRLGKHQNPHLQSSWDLYGPEAFSISIIEVVDDLTQLLSREQHYLDSIPNLYNMAPKAAAPPITEANTSRSRAISRSHAERRRLGIKRTYGPEFSEICRQRMLGAKDSDATRKRKSEAAKEFWQRRREAA